MMLKLVVLSLCVLCCVAFPKPSRFFGNILKGYPWKYRYLGTEDALKQARMHVGSRHTFTFPNPSRQDPDTQYIINAIEQVDHSKHDVKVDFVKGGIGSNEVTMTVTAPKGKGIGSQFHFYGMKIPREPARDFLTIPTAQDPFKELKEQQAIFNFVPEAVDPPRHAAMGA